MNFTNIPKNGASWNDKLLYGFSLDSDVGRDVGVVVRDADSGEELGRMQLYAVTEATVDIAPIVRRATSVEPVVPTSQILVTSPSMRRVVVEVDGVASPAVMLFRSTLTLLSSEVLSSMSTANGIASGEYLRFTVSEMKGVTITVREMTGSRGRLIAGTSDVYSMRVAEVVVPVGELSEDADRVVVMVSDGIRNTSYEYPIVKRTAGSRTLLWYNSRGGIESYVFPYSRLLSRRADVASTTTASGRESHLVAAESRVRLTSAVLSRAEQERLVEILRSPYVFEDVAGEIRAVELASREVGYDDHGALQRLSLDIVEEWKGGGL